MKSFNRLLFAAAALAGLSVASADELRTMRTAMQTVPLEYRLDGVVEARRQATLSAEVAGKIESVNFDVDDHVDKGAVVLRIRDREYRAGLRQAQAALDEATALLEDARLEFERSGNLRRQKLISEADFDRAEARLRAAEARKTAAEASRDRAEEQLGYTVIRAPYSGVVVERHVEPGESVSPGQAIMSGYSQDQLRVSAHVPQSIVGALRERRSARVILLESSDSIEVAEITIHPFASPSNHSFPVRLDLPESTPGIFPGMLVKVALEIGSIERLLLPREALVSRSEVNAVYVIDSSGQLSLRQVRPGNRYDDRVEILAGLEADEIVALDPVEAGIALKRQLEESR